jgi:hypothetical protein
MRDQCGPHRTNQPDYFVGPVAREVAPVGSRTREAVAYLSVWESCPLRWRQRFYKGNRVADPRLDAPGRSASPDEPALLVS